MQKLSAKLKNIPGNASQVPCSISTALNRDQSLSVSSIVLTDNNSDENLLLSVGGLKANTLVYVINENGNPLMPCKPAKARHLLEACKAKIVNHMPFTIQLTWNCEDHKQDITLGINPGYSWIGFSAITSKTSLISGELELRKDIKKLLEQRANYRHTRRSRLWHREPRFNNRSKPAGWLAPSIQHRLDTHVRLIDLIKSILPVTKTVIELAKFDTQKMQNPEISGIEYQQGTLQGYEIREYLLEKWSRKCAYCSKHNVPLEIEHIIPRSRGGSNRVNNLTITCHSCNQSKGNQTAEEFGYPNIQAQAKKPLRATAFMNVVKQRLVDLVDCYTTFGYITKRNRILLNIPKSHSNDAFIIAEGTTQEQFEPYRLKQVRHQNRSLFKANLLKGGILKRNTIKQIKEFRRYDKVLYNKTICFIHGLRTSGYFDIRTITGTKIHASANVKKLTLLEHARGFMMDGAIQPLPHGSVLFAQ